MVNDAQRPQGDKGAVYSRMRLHAVRFSVTLGVFWLQVWEFSACRSDALTGEFRAWAPCRFLL